MKDLHIPSHIMIASIDENTVLLDSKKNTYYSLNDSAAEFWKYLEQMGSFESALNQMLKVYGDPTHSIREDMEELIKHLLKVGLLERVNNK